MSDLRTSVGERVQGPAIALLVCGILIAVGGVVSLLFSLFGQSMMSAVLSDAEARGQVLPPAFVQGLALTFGLGANLINIALGAFIAYAGWQMRNLKSLAMAQVAAVLALVPCCSGTCCLIGLPIGIWALIVLNRPDVRSAFDANAAN